MVIENQLSLHSGSPNIEYMKDEEMSNDCSPHQSSFFSVDISSLSISTCNTTSNNDVTSKLKDQVH